jgi:hypothetical protein
LEQRRSITEYDVLQCSRGDAMQPIYSTSNGFVSSVNGELRSFNSLRELLALLELQRIINAAFWYQIPAYTN